MPDLNLQDEGSFDNLENLEEGESQAWKERPKKKGKGRGATILVVLLAMLVVGAGAVYLLNRLGIIKLPGRKATPQVVQLQEPTPSNAPGERAADTAGTEMIETPPLQEAGHGAAKTALTPAGKPSAAAPVREMPTSTVAPRLGEMSGEYTIHVSAWRDKSVAEIMVTRLGEAGYPAYVEERPYKGRILFTVCIGRYPSRKAAQNAVQSFAEEIRSNHVIARVRAQ
jgi:cell division septation protein DedD